ncbi:MAG: hypothetical protein NW205_08495 [Hyphomicrobiaceae bacterium]|nr:hypothetical protein [Hyphomicrobiaceae bacterium]
MRLRFPQSSRLRLALPLAVIAALTVPLPPTPVLAADLDEDPRYRTSDPYDDPRYRDMYEVPEPRVNGPRDDHPGYAERDDAPYDEPAEGEEPYAEADVPDERAYRQDRYADEPLDPVEPKYRGGQQWQEPRYDDRRRHAAACLDDGEIRRVLRAEGWKDFDDYRRRGRLVTTEAERFGSGRDFLLTIDGCTGVIIDVLPKRGWDGHRYDTARREAYRDPAAPHDRDRRTAEDLRGERYAPREPRY